MAASCSMRSIYANVLDATMLTPRPQLCARNLHLSYAFLIMEIALVDAELLSYYLVMPSRCVNTASTGSSHPSSSHVKYLVSLRGCLSITANTIQVLVLICASMVNWEQNSGKSAMQNRELHANSDTLFLESPPKSPQL